MTPGLDGTRYLRYSVSVWFRSGVVQLVARQPLELVILVRVQAPEPTPLFLSGLRQSFRDRKNVHKNVMVCQQFWLRQRLGI